MRNKYKLAKYLCSTNVFTAEDKTMIMALAKKHCNGDPHNDQAVLWGYICQVSEACD